MSTTVSGADAISTHPVTGSHAGHVSHPEPIAVAQTTLRDAPPDGRTILLPLTGLACVGAALIATNVLGEFDRMLGQLTETTDFFMFNAVDVGYYPSVPGYLGVAFAGPAGAIIGVSLVACTLLGWLAQRNSYGHGRGFLGRALPLIGALPLPLLVVDFMIFSAIEFVNAQTIPFMFEGHPERVAAWVVVALSCAAALCVAANGLILRWAWRRVSRPAAPQREPATV
jgi:hypothetical protein